MARLYSAYGSPDSALRPFAPIFPPLNGLLTAALMSAGRHTSGCTVLVHLIMQRPARPIEPRGYVAVSP
jgi:hypothetical protein